MLAAKNLARLKVIIVRITNGLINSIANSVLEVKNALNCLLHDVSYFSY